MGKRKNSETSKLKPEKKDDTVDSSDEDEDFLKEWENKQYNVDNDSSDGEEDDEADLDEGNENYSSDELSFEEDETDIDENDSEKADDDESNKDITVKESIKKYTKKSIKQKLKNTNQESEKTEQSDKDEYASGDTSDEEDIRNTIGNIPVQWYDDFSHLGYDWDGEKILKPEQGDKLDDFLKRMEDPDFWKTVKDPRTGQNVVLSEDDIQLIKRVQAQKIPDANFDEYAPWIEWFTSEVMKTPIRKFPEHKRSFLPSRSEAKKVSKLVHALKMGWIKTRSEQAKLRAKKQPQYYMLWSADDTPEEIRRIHKHIPAPKRHLPGHAESYNPPPEYLFDSKEMKEWNKLQNAPWKRKLHFVPQKFNSLREVPAYSRYIKERFLRCLDLYLCPRAIKMKLTIDAESLVPKLPSPRDLQPFPTKMDLIFKGHTDMIRTMSIEPVKGQYMATGSDDCSVKIWEIAQGRCVHTFKFDDVVRCVAWCPNTALSLLAVATGKTLCLINPNVGDINVTVKKTDTLLEKPPVTDVIVNERVQTAVKWENIDPSSDDWASGIRIKVHHFKVITQVTWHGRGDYLATVMPEGQNRSVLIHQLSKRRSQIPFTKSKGLVQCVLFHPIRPYLFVATQKNVRIYDLVKQELMKKLLTNCQWISSMAIHSGGDNLLVGTFDRKMLWFDLDLSTKPYQTLRLHGTAVRAVAFHKRYPLFASGSDDRSLIISHGMVYNDLLQNPLIVPLKRLQNHEAYNDFGILDVQFHPVQPWVFSCGADATVRLYT